ncbi:MAG: class I adenylate-forming enzyme family protein [Pseudomonadota bacterium]
MGLTTSLFDEGPPPPCPARFNMAGYVLGAAVRTPEKDALLVLGPDGALLERWSYQALADAVLGTAAGLRERGLRRGDRVLLRLGNVSDFPILFFGTVAAGGIAVPTSSQLTAAEFARIAEDTGARFVAADPTLETPDGVAERLGPADWSTLLDTAPEPAADTDADDPAFLIYTSGTGGRPKGVLHAHRSAWARRMMWEGWYGLGPTDVMLHAGAFNWTYTLGAGLTDPWAAGATTLIATGGPAADAWPRLSARYRPTLFAAVPGVYRQMLRNEAGLAGAFAALRHGLTAGERMPEALAETWTAATGKPVYEALGMSEVSTYISSSPAVPRRTSRAGRPQAGRRIAVLEEAGTVAPIGTPGQLAVSKRDPGLMLGYWRQPDATEAAFAGEWFLTGDRVAMDPDGYVEHLGRTDEVMTSLGYRVSPAEVEMALADHPAVSEIAVAELPVRADLSLIAAFVVPNGDWPGETALASHADARLAPYKQPKLWIAVDRLPRTANGKLLRRALVEAHRRDR